VFWSLEKLRGPEWGRRLGPTEDARDCLLERTWRGQNLVKLADGTERKFL